MTPEARYQALYEEMYALCEDNGWGDPFSYARSRANSINATYNGISVQDTWEEQERYLIEDKIGKYKNHYYARYEGGKIVEVWRLDCDDVLNIVLPKAKKQYPKKKNGNAKDPRIGVTISKKEIYAIGTCILG